LNNLPIEVWDAGGTNNYFYTEVKIIADMLKRDFKRPAIYMKRGRIIGWQFCIPKRLEGILIPRIAELMELKTSKINDLAAQQCMHLHYTANIITTDTFIHS